MNASISNVREQDAKPKYTKRSKRRNLPGYAFKSTHYLSFAQNCSICAKEEPQA